MLGTRGCVGRGGWTEKGWEGTSSTVEGVREPPCVNRTPQTHTHHAPEKFSNWSPLELFESKGKKTTKQNSWTGKWRVSQAGWVASVSVRDGLRHSHAPLEMRLKGSCSGTCSMHFAWRKRLPLPPSLHPTVPPTSCRTRSPTSLSTRDVTPSW